MSAHQSRTRDRAAEELTSYFWSAESTLGLSSGLGGLLEGGFGSAPDPERKVLRRHKLALEGDTDVTRSRPIRDALMKLEPEHTSALFAAYGPLDWSHAIDEAFGRGMGAKVVKHLGDLAGVALLTAGVARGFAKDRDKAQVKQADLVIDKRMETDRQLRTRLVRVAGVPSDEVAAAVGSEALDALAVANMSERDILILRAFRPTETADHFLASVNPKQLPKRWLTRAKPWDTPGGWLVALCLRKNEDGHKRIKREAELLLNAGRWAYADARGYQIELDDSLALKPEPAMVRPVRPHSMPEVIHE